MAIFFSRILRRNLLSTAIRIPAAGCCRCSWKMRPMWYRSEAAEEKMEPCTLSRKNRAYWLPCSAESFSQWTA